MREEKHIQIQIKARYFTLGQYNKHNPIWFVLHGYGQLARYFIKKFEPIVEMGAFVIAPEGLSRYYLEGFRGRVGSSWMTKEDRLSDIENYIAFLDEVHRAEIPEDHDPRSITLLGFSQGAATASRCAVSGKATFGRLILWSGIFPPDLEPLSASQRLNGIPVHLVYGESDPFLTEERLIEQASIGKSLNVDYQTMPYDGGHDIDRTSLLKFHSE